MPQPFGPSQLRGCGTVVSSPLVEPLGSPSVRPRPVATVAYRFRVFEASFPILQNDTVFQSRFQSDSYPLGLNRILCRLVVSVPLFLTSVVTEARPRIRFVIHKSFLPRKEVIQPHLPIRLPCYDFTPVIGLTFDGCALAVHSPASGAPNSHGVTGGVYKARERIHRGMLIRDY